MGSWNLWVVLVSLILNSANSLPLESKQHNQLKEDIKSIKDEIKELFERINELSSSNSDEGETFEVDDAENRICLSKECVAASHSLFQRMDLTADPCQDFNQFSCGNFIKDILIPDDKTRYSSFTPPSIKGRLFTKISLDFSIFLN